MLASSEVVVMRIMIDNPTKHYKMNLSIEKVLGTVANEG